MEDHRRRRSDCLTFDPHRRTSQRRLWPNISIHPSRSVRSPSTRCPWTVAGFCFGLSGLCLDSVPGLSPPLHLAVFAVPGAAARTVGRLAGSPAAATPVRVEREDGVALTADDRHNKRRRQRDEDEDG